MGKMALSLGIHPTLLSLILAGTRDLNEEHTYDLALYLQLTELETEFFSHLVSYSRAGNHRYKQFIKLKLEAIRKKSEKISNRFEHEKTLTESQRAIFYSSWLYSAIRLFCSTSEKGKTAEEISARFQKSRQSIISILNFLHEAGLVHEENGRYTMGSQRTFLEQGSPHLGRHHTNWRNKAIQKMEDISEKELMFTSPISVSRSDFEKIREEIASLLKSVSITVKESPAEEIACLNIDLFWIEK